MLAVPKPPSAGPAEPVRAVGGRVRLRRGRELLTAHGEGASNERGDLLGATLSIDEELAAPAAQQHGCH